MTPENRCAHLLDGVACGVKCRGLFCNDHREQVQRTDGMRGLVRAA